jgi:hypothetical protein
MADAMQADICNKTAQQDPASSSEKSRARRGRGEFGVLTVTSTWDIQV